MKITFYILYVVVTRRTVYAQCSLDYRIQACTHVICNHPINILNSPGVVAHEVLSQEVDGIELGLVDVGGGETLLVDLLQESFHS